MKLFVWKEPYDVKWGSSTLFVVANDLEEARAHALNTSISEYGSIPHRDQIALPDIGEPDWILDMPGALAYEWAE